jgi:hypothetical protein
MNKPTYIIFCVALLMAGFALGHTVCYIQNKGHMAEIKQAVDEHMKKYHE